METKDLLTCSIKEISSEGLSQLQLVITDELDHRRSRAKEAAWKKLVDAIKDYSTTFGRITIIGEYETLCLDGLDDYSSIGEIQINFGR